MRFIDFEWWKGLAVVMAALVLYSLYGPVFHHPNDFLFGAGGDAVKNYFTFAWHVKYDNDWTHFGGTNYPYGEHVGYTDGHPLFSLLLGWIPLVKAYPVATLNILMLVSQIITIRIVYSILRSWSVVSYVAALGAMSIVWLQPQLFRMEGHLSLSYTWVIPYAILLLTRFWQHRNFGTLIWLGIYISAIFLLHPYLGLMLSMMVCVFGLVYLILARFKPQDDGHWIGILISGILPVFLFIIFMRATDGHEQRPDIAIGFLQQTSNVEAVFQPNHDSVSYLFSPETTKGGHVDEGSAYIGFATVIILLAFVLSSVVNRRKVVEEDLLPRILIISSLIILLFSFGFPFKYGMQDWLARIPYLEQFRAPGRFAWVFYYASTLMTFYIVNEWTEKFWWNSKKIVVAALPLLVSGVYFIEGYMPQKTMAERILTHKNELTNCLDSSFVHTVQDSMLNKATAIVPIPFFHFGSDYYGIHAEDEVMKASYALALHSGIPLVASSNPRVSLLESRKIMQLFAPFYVEKPIWKDFSQEQPRFYIFNALASQNAEMQGRLVLDPDSARAVYLAFSNACYNKNLDKVGEMASLHLGVDSVEITDEKNVLFPFATAAKSADYITLKTFAPGELRATEKYIASVKLTGSDLYKVRTMMVLESQGEKKEWLEVSHCTMSPMIFGDSLLLELPFTIQDTSIGYSIFIKGSDDLPEDYNYSQFFVRKANELWIDERRDAAGQNVLFVNGVALTRFND